MVIRSGVPERLNCILRITALQLFLADSVPGARNLDVHRSVSRSHRSGKNKKGYYNNNAKRDQQYHLSLNDAEHDLTFTSFTGFRYQGPAALRTM
jgi:hypothetical protein